jgi:hypothetical protein
LCDPKTRKARRVGKNGMTVSPELKINTSEEKHMKKKLITLTLALLVALATAMSGCAGGITDDPTEPTEPLITSPQPTTQMEAVAPETGNVPKILDSYTDGTNNYYILDAGYIKNVFISNLAEVDYVGLPYNNYIVTATVTSQITDSLTEAVSSTHTYSRTDSTKIGLSAQWKNKVNLFVAKSELTVKASAEWTWTGTTTDTDTKSTSNTTATAQTYSEQKTFPFSLGANSEPLGYYRYALYGVVDVYYIIETSPDNQAMLGWNIAACARSNDYFVRYEYSADGKFENPPKNDVTFNEDFYKELDPPDNTAEDSFGDTYSTEFITIRDTEYTITDSGRFNQPLDLVAFSEFGVDLGTMRTFGYKTVSFKLRLNVCEVNDGYQFIALFSSTAQDNQYLLARIDFEHTPGSADKSWRIHYEAELKFDNVSVDALTNNQFIIRYGASGSGNDTWKNKDLQIQLIFNR